MNGQPFARLLKKTKAWLVFSKKQILTLLVATYIIPLTVCEPDLTLYSVMLVALFSALLLFELYEKKLKKTVDALVKSKIKGLSLPTPQTEAKLKAKELEVIKLKTALEENIRGYEHQLDLLQSSAQKSREKAEELSYEMQRRSGGLKQAHLRYEDLRKEYGHLHDEYLALQAQANEKLKRSDSLLAEYQHTINEQRRVIEKKQRQIASLETKVSDLMYEIRSLLKLEQPPAEPLPLEMESPPSPAETDSLDLPLVLNRYLEMAHGLTGVDHLGYVGGSEPRFLDATHGNFHLDLRRLFDSFGDENTAVVFVYSKQERKFLFVNNHIKNLLGWSPEKFIKDFFHLSLHGAKDWEKEMRELSAHKQRRMALALKSKGGEEVLVESLFSIIEVGPFAGHVLGIFSPHSSHS